MSIGGHVVVDVNEFGGIGGVIGDHVELSVMIRECDWNVMDSEIRRRV